MQIIQFIYKCILIFEKRDNLFIKHDVYINVI